MIYEQSAMDKQILIFQNCDTHLLNVQGGSKVSLYLFFFFLFNETSNFKKKLILLHTSSKKDRNLTF